MPSEEYSLAASNSSALKLKGSKIHKSKHKHKHKSKSKDTDQSQPKETSLPQDDTKDESNTHDQQPNDKELEPKDTDGSEGKTAAEIEHAQRRRARLFERLKREGAQGKTHKERVEELNRYLSRLSEHHDMPRIGPG